MRVRINSIQLLGTSRSVAFSAGLNVITGPISSGKTTLLRLVRGLLGGTLEDLPREVRQTVPALLGEIVLGEEPVKILRQLVTTPTAPVEIASASETQRLPASRLEQGKNETYGQWLMRKLGLPSFEVAISPTRPDSATSPITINDYMLYCHLPQDEIDNSVLGHHDQYKNTKRKFVFEVVYGLYDVEVARVAEELRAVQQRLRARQASGEIIEKFLSGTALESRAAIENQLEKARQELVAVEATVLGEHESVVAVDENATLREEVRRIDAESDRLQRASRSEATSAEQLRLLQNQVDAQIGRLTKAIVADTLLVDFDFILCPRCGSSLQGSRRSDDQCYLCGKVPERQVSRDDLLEEQRRLESQLAETRELIAARDESVARIAAEIDALTKRRAELASELDFQSRTYVSDAAARIAQLAAKRSELRAEVRRLGEFLGMSERREALRLDIAQGLDRLESLQAEFDRLSARRTEAKERIARLSDEFNQLLEAFHVPRFPPAARGWITPDNYMPMLGDRRFDELSSQGLKVLVNVAHAIAHQRTAVALNLTLPNILIIDGPTSNIGHEGRDLEVVNSLYTYLIQLSAELGDRLQIIAVDHDVPEFAREYIRLSFGPDDRLIPPDSLEKARGRGE